MSRVLAHRLDPTEPIPSGRPITRSRAPSRLDPRAADRLDLGARIAMAADIQSTAGNAAMAHAVGFARTDHATQPPGGVKEIGDAAHSPGNRGYTQAKYVGNPPLFRPGKNEPGPGGQGWVTRPAPVKLPDLDFDVWWPAPGRHKLAEHWFLDVSQDWSDKLKRGEEEHVTDTQKAYDMTWGRVASIVNDMAASSTGSTGATVPAATDAAWASFVGRLPQGFKPAGTNYSTDEQEKLWGNDDEKTIFRQLMNETKAVRDGKLWHHPDEGQKAKEGDDVIYELTAGQSHIGETTSEKLIGDAWKRLTGGP